MKFTHLHVHSHYSLLDGLPKIDELLHYAKELGMDSIAITDHGVLYGAVEFFKKAKEKGIKPIIGSEIYLALEKMQQKRPNIDDKRHHLVLLVKNEEGYKNLVKLITKAHLEGFYYRPRIDEEILQKHSQGLIGLSACLQGKIPRLILAKKLKEAEQLCLKYQKIFGKDNFYLELQHHPNIADQKKVNEALISLSKKLAIPLVATNDVHYSKPEDAEAQDILMLINTGADPNDPERLTMRQDDFSLRSPEKMIKDFKDIPEAIENTQKIAKSCNFEFELGKTKLPYFPLPEGKSADDHLKELCYSRLEKRYQKPSEEITARLEYELSVIKQTGFAPYFLIVQDFVNWAKENRIVVGPGRGCLLPNTKILMADGEQRSIQNIKTGEEVISKDGKKQKVVNVFDYDIDEKIAIVKSKMPTSRKAELTQDHKVLAVKHKMCPVMKDGKSTICKPTCRRSCKNKLWKNYKLEWIEAKNLKKNDLLVYPITPSRHSKKFTFDLLRFDKNLKGDSKHAWYETGTNKLIQKKVFRYIKLDRKLATFLGFYIAEGWSRTKQRESAIGFGFNQDEKEYIKEVKKLFKEIFDLEASIINHKSRHSTQIYAYSLMVGKFLEKLCGKGAENKHIPKQIFECSDMLVQSLLTTLFRGDGSRKDSMRISFDSISLNLVSQVKMLLARLGIMSSIKIRRFKQKNWHTNYKLTISGQQLFKFNQLFPEFQIPIKKQRFYRNDTFILKNYVYFPVKSVGFRNYKGKVYDFSVEKDTSYVANDIAVHNSAAGSLVSFVLNITNVDPLEYELLFERFLNPERVALPDIDLDFADRRRDEVIEYVAQKYGRDKVAQIITFGTMAARAVVRDVGRALGYTYSYCDQLAKMIPFGFTLDQALEKIDEFRQSYIQDEEAKKLIDLAKKLEGVARHASTHACGVVIAKDPLETLVPLQHPTQNEESIVTQYEMHSIEDLGLLKMDFLGLKNLTIIEDTLSRIYKVHDKSIDIQNIPLDDKRVYRLLQQGDTVGVFQLESAGMQRYLKQLKPTEFEDIIAMVALYRPGPMQLIPDYIARKHKKKKIEYLHPKLKPILEKTQGICVTGDTVVQLANPGSIMEIKKVISSETPFTVQSLENGKFTKRGVLAKFDNGIQDVYEITLRTGKKIKATRDHQFLTPEGWKQVAGLSLGDFLATPRRLFTGKMEYDTNRLKALAYLLADGALTNGVSCYFVNKNMILLREFKRCVESSFDNTKVRFTKHIRGVRRANPSKRVRKGFLYHMPNSLLKWLRELGLKTKDGGMNSAQKRIPGFVFRLKERYISEFLAAFWDCDGGIARKMAYTTVISKKLVYDLQTLLLKLGINSFVYQPGKYISRNKKPVKTYRLIIYDMPHFYRSVGRFMMTVKRNLAERYAIDNKNGFYKEFVPRKLFLEKLLNYKEKNNLTQREISSKLGIGRKGFFGLKEREKNRLNISIAKKIADLLRDEDLQRLSDEKTTRWEDIRKIEYIGKERVYDIEVKNSHNFIANNIISHNCIYQEQLMQIAQQLAGFTLAEADILRKAVGKKIKKLLLDQKEKFIKGMAKNGIETGVAQKLWEWILPFAHYGFNRSHSASYATIAYQTAYLKTHYPVEFMSAVLTSERADIERIAVLIEECKKMGIEVLPPDINESFMNFSVVPKARQIRFGLLAIKNVGHNVVEAILQERKTNGLYASIEDFVSRVSSKDLNKKSLESSIKAGVFDKLGERNQLLNNLEKLLEHARATQKTKSNGQKGLFDGTKFTSTLALAQTNPSSEAEKLKWEKELLGLYVSGHPLKSYKEILEKKSLPIVKISHETLGKLVKVGGIISGIKKIITRVGKPMLFLNLEDETKRIEIVVFPSIIERNPAIFQENKIVLISGKVDMRDGIPKIICNEIEEIIEK